MHYRETLSAHVIESPETREHIDVHKLFKEFEENINEFLASIEATQSIHKDACYLLVNLAQHGFSEEVFETCGLQLRPDIPEEQEVLRALVINGMSERVYSLIKKNIN